MSRSEINGESREESHEDEMDPDREVADGYSIKVAVEIVSSSAIDMMSPRS
jgi:hypothetical protein